MFECDHPEDYLIEEIDHAAGTRETICGLCGKELTFEVEVVDLDD